MRECCAATGVNAPVYRAAPGYRSLYAIGGRPPLAEDMRRRLQQWIYRSAATFTASRFNFAGPCGRASPFAAWQKSSPFGHRHSSYALDRPAPLKRNAKGAARERASRPEWTIVPLTELFRQAFAAYSLSFLSQKAPLRYGNGASLTVC